MNWYIINTSEKYPDCRSFSYKMTPQEKVYYTPGSSDGPGSEEAGATVDLAGKSYTYTASNKTYTVVFSSDGTFERSVSNLSTKDTGSWSVSGSTLTLKMTKGVEMEETFTASQTDSQLTLKTTSGADSNILTALFGVIQASSITIELKS